MSEAAIRMTLANVSLAWMLAEAGQSGLRFKEFPNDDPDALLRVDSAKDKDGRLTIRAVGSAGIIATARG